MVLSRYIGICIMLVTAATPATAQWTNGQAADLVLGQSNFTTNTPGGGATSLYAPTSVAIDPRTGKLFVADIANNRVLRWAASASLTSGAPAEAVLGQTNFDTISTAVARNRMNFPTAVVIDAAGRLWVADASNNRVLRFDNAAVKPTGADADGVLGQPDFDSNTMNITRNGMYYVRGLAIDKNGTLYVSDQANNRVLRFDNAALKTNGADADGVLGQLDFISNKDTVLQNGLKWPRGLVVDPQGHLYVSSSSQHRVLRFDNAATKANGADADAVLGQGDFTSASLATTRNGLNEPTGLAIDATGRLYVADYSNHRVLWFNHAASKANGADADGVLGQQDFVSDTAMAGPTGMENPWGLELENERGKLWVADASNNRVLRFTATSSLLSVGDVTSAENGFALSQNYPNPVRRQAMFEYTLPHPASIRLEIYSMLGRRLETLVDADKQQGTHRVNWTNEALPTGQYAVILRVGGKTAFRIMSVLR